ncbi:NUDIX hydrolase [Promicromonospora sp. Populi]|uniref:NUDIX hydrolase n=1 Tax=Promicromonospora sp. Populi TaxID=3239420 RepID=UPI0034E21E4F
MRGAAEVTPDDGVPLQGALLQGALLHDDALRVLRSWTGPTPEQERLRVRYVWHLETHDPSAGTGADAGTGSPSGVFRDCVPDHLTASTLVLSHDGTRVLLTMHAKARRWFQFGGHLEAGDRTLAGAAEREAREESGLTLSVDPVPVHLDEHEVPFCRPGVAGGLGTSAGSDSSGGSAARPDSGEGVGTTDSPGEADRPVHHLDVRFVAVAAPDAEPVLSEESLDVRWWDVDALPNRDLTEPVRLARARVGARVGA